MVEQQVVEVEEVEVEVEGDSRSREWRLRRREERVGRSGSVSALTSAQELCNCVGATDALLVAAAICLLSDSRAPHGRARVLRGRRWAKGDGESEGVSDASGRVVSCGCRDVT